MPVMPAAFSYSGPLMMIAVAFQAIGDACGPRSWIVDAPSVCHPADLRMAARIGEPCIEIAGPAAELLLLALTGVALTRAAQLEGLRWGLFRSRRTTVLRRSANRIGKPLRTV